MTCSTTRRPAADFDIFNAADLFLVILAFAPRTAMNRRAFEQLYVHSLTGNGRCRCPPPKKNEEGKDPPAPPRPTEKEREKRSPPLAAPPAPPRPPPKRKGNNALPAPPPPPPRPPTPPTTALVKRCPPSRSSPSASRAPVPAATLSFNVASGLWGARWARRPRPRSCARFHRSADGFAWSFEGAAHAFGCCVGLRSACCFWPRSSSSTIVLGVLYERLHHPSRSFRLLPRPCRGALALIIVRSVCLSSAHRHHLAHLHRARTPHDDRLRVGGRAADQHLPRHEASTRPWPAAAFGPSMMRRWPRAWRSAARARSGTVSELRAPGNHHRCGLLSRGCFTLLHDAVIDLMREAALALDLEVGRAAAAR